MTGAYPIPTICGDHAGIAGSAPLVVGSLKNDVGLVDNLLADLPSRTPLSSPSLLYPIALDLLLCSAVLLATSPAFSSSLLASSFVSSLSLISLSLLSSFSTRLRSFFLILATSASSAAARSVASISAGEGGGSRGELPFERFWRTARGASSSDPGSSSCDGSRARD